MSKRLLFNMCMVFLLSILFVSAYPTPTHWWTMNDTSGNDLGTGSITLSKNGDVYSTSGVIDNGSIFDGNGDSYTGSGLSTSYSSISVSVWVNMSDQNNADGRGYTIIHQNEGGSYGFWAVTSTDFDSPNTTHSEVQCYHSNGVNSDTVVKYNISRLEWHHVACTQNATGNATLYVDGVKVATGARSSGFGPEAGDFSIGKHAFKSETWMVGGIDEVKLWIDYDLTDTSVQELYGEGVDIINPIVQSSSAADTSGGLNTSFNITANITDNTAVSQGWVQITTPSSSKTNYTMTFNGSGNGLYNLTFVPDETGTYTFKIFANDTNGNTNNGSNIILNNSLRTGIVTYYNWNNNTFGDSVGNYDGTNSGTTNTSGKLGDARDFDGGNDMITLGTTASKWFTTDKVTLNTWVNLDVNTTNAYDTLIGNPTDSSGTWCMTFGMVFNWGSGGNAYFEAEQTPCSGGYLGLDAHGTVGISINTWHMITGTYNGSEQRIYIDGILRANRTQSGTMGTNDNFVIGRWRPGDPMWYDGQADEMGIWNRSLTENEVLNLYNNDNGKSYSVFTTETEDVAQGSFSGVISRPPVLSNYNLTSDGGCEVWNTNKSTQCNTTDNTPTISWDTDIQASCAIGRFDYNHSTMNDTNTTCGSGTSFQCTLSGLGKAYSLSVGNNTLYIGCENQNGNENSTSSSGGLELFYRTNFAVTLNYPGNNYNQSYGIGGLDFNFTVVGDTDNYDCDLNVSNSTGSTISLLKLSNVLNNIPTIFTANFSAGTYARGINTWGVNCSNQFYSNSSELRTFNITNTPPIWITNISNTTILRDNGTTAYITNLPSYVNDTDGDTVYFKVKAENVSKVDCKASVNTTSIDGDDTEDIYGYSGSFPYSTYNYTKAVDEDWSTEARVNILDSEYSYIYENYIIPDNLINHTLIYKFWIKKTLGGGGSRTHDFLWYWNSTEWVLLHSWTVPADTPSNNITNFTISIPEAAVYGDVLQLRVSVGSNYDGYALHWYYEGKMLWNVSDNMNALNITPATGFAGLASCTIGINDSLADGENSTFWITITQADLNLSCNNQYDSGKYEYQTTAECNITSNVGSLEACLDIDSPNEGINVSCGTVPVKYNYTIDLLSQQNFSDGLIIHNITSTDKICYQETANISTSCGGLSGGSYFFSGCWNPSSCSSRTNLYDGNLSTYAYTSDGGVNAYMTIIYKKPYKALNSSLWQIKDNNDIVNLTIPSGCWNYHNQQISLRVHSNWPGSSPGNTYWQCDNGSWVTLRTDNSGRDVYEEGMWWNISGGTIKILMDNRTTLTNTTINLTGHINNSVYPQDVIIKIGSEDQLVLPGKLIGNLFTQNQFIYSGVSYSGYNLSWITGGTTKQVRFNTTTSPITRVSEGVLTNRTPNITFTITGYELDAGNDFVLPNPFIDENRTENYTNNNLSVYTSQFENFENTGVISGRWTETDSSFCVKSHTTCDPVSWDEAVITTGNLDDYYYFHSDPPWLTTGSSEDSYSYNRHIIDISTEEFSMDNISRIDIEWWWNLKDNNDEELSCDCSSSSYAGTYFQVTDGTSKYTLRSIVSNGLDGGVNTQKTGSENLTLKKVDTYTWEISNGTFIENKTITGLDTGADWTFNIRGGVHTEYIKVAGEPNCLCESEHWSKIYSINLGGISLPRGIYNESFSSLNGTVVSDVVFTAPSNVTTSYFSAKDYTPENTSITYYITSDNGTTWQIPVSDVNFYNMTGNLLAWKAEMNSSNENVSPRIDSIDYRVVPSTPENLTIGGVVSYTFNNKLNASTTPISLTFEPDDIISELYSDCTNVKTCTQLITLSIITPGIIEISNFNYTQPINPIDLNKTALESCNECLLNLTYTNGIIEAKDVRFDFVGSWNLTATAHDVGRTITDTFEFIVRHSPFNITLPWPYKYVSINPVTLDSKEVAPRGQTDSVGIFNVSSLAYEDLINVYLMFNTTLDDGNCTTFYLNNESTNVAKIVLNTTGKELLSGVNVSGSGDFRYGWMWTNLSSCSYSDVAYLYPLFTFNSLCDSCITTFDALTSRTSTLTVD